MESVTEGTVMAQAMKTMERTQDAIELLKADHREVEELFASFEDTEDEDESSSIAERVCKLLTIHAQIEEDLLYPAAKDALQDDEEDVGLVNEAEVEHGSAKELIAQIESMTPADEHFKATVKVLSEYVKHHGGEEEKGLFTKLKRTDLDLDDLGERLASQKVSMMEEMGLEPDSAEEEDEEHRPASRRSHASKTARKRK
jgi:hemerythrin superfamily protein